MRLIEGIEKVWAGEVDFVKHTYRPHNDITIVAFFELNNKTEEKSMKVSIKKYKFEKNRHGGAYVKGAYNWKFYFKPYVRVLEIVGRGKSGQIRELSYQAGMLDYLANESFLGGEIFAGLKFSMNLEGLKRDRLYDNIIPWGNPISMEEPVKRVWRHDNMKEIFKALKIPYSKSMAKALINNINRVKNANSAKSEFPDTRALKMIWKLCEDPNLFCSLVDDMCDYTTGRAMFEIIGRDNRLEAFMNMISKWRRKQKNMFLRSLIGMTRHEADLWRDSLRMMNDIYLGLGQIDVRASNVKMLHDKLIGDAVKVEHNDNQVPILYEEELMSLSGYEFHVGMVKYKMMLPPNMGTIRSWGKTMRNCMGGYAKSVANRYTTLVGIEGTINNKSKIVVGLEWNDRKIIQMSCFANTAVPKMLRTAIVRAFMDLNLIDKGHENHGRNGNQYHREIVAVPIGNGEVELQQAPLDQDHPAQCWLPGVTVKITARQGFIDRHRAYGGAEDILAEEAQRIRRANEFDNQVPF